MLGSASRAAIARSTQPGWNSMVSSIRAMYSPSTS